MRVIAFGKNSIKIAGVYTAVVLGAGFASGQELMRYFVRFGVMGIAGLMFAGALFALVGWAVLDICHRESLRDYASFINYLTGEKFGLLIEVCVAIFLCVLFVTMIAAGGATFKEAFGLPTESGVLVVAGLCFIAMLFDAEGMVKVNTILAPFMVAGGIFIGIYSFISGPKIDSGVFELFAASEGSWLLSAGVYSAYNIITAVSVLASLGYLVDSKKTAFWGGLLGGIAMTALAVCISLMIFFNYSSVAHYEIPMLRIVQGYGELFKYFYLLILLAAIYTTAVSSAFGFVTWVQSRFRVNIMPVKIVLVVCGIAASYGGFSNFVSYAYPAFGFIGLLEILVILLWWFFGDRHELKQCARIKPKAW